MNPSLFFASRVTYKNSLPVTRVRHVRRLSRRGRPSRPTKDTLNDAGLSSFESLGLRAPIATSLRTAFPNVEHPTYAQSQFIPAILDEKNVILNDLTGSGKSFGVVLALLSKPRVVFMNPGDYSQKAQNSKSVTSLVLVPHRDLAQQLLHWIKCLVTADVKQAPPLESVVQVLTRPSHLSTGITKVKAEPPHILISTPQAIMDVINEEPSISWLQQLSAIFVDEVDYQVETASSSKPDHFRAMKDIVKLQRKIDLHPSAAKQLLDTIYMPSVKDSSRSSRTTPQLIVCSATLSRHLRNHLVVDSGWLNGRDIVTVNGRQDPLAPSDISSKERRVDCLHGDILHSVLLVSQGRVENIHTAVPESTIHVDTRPHVSNDPAWSTSIPQAVSIIPDPESFERYADRPSPFNPYVLETVATTFALDVPQMALLIIPSSAAVSRVVFDLRTMGVNAYGLDLMSPERGQDILLAHNTREIPNNPRLLVGTPATIRGIHVPDLSHVFIINLPGKSADIMRYADDYVHFSGRVGRNGRGGRVISVLELSEDKMQRQEKSDGGWEDGSKMANMLRQLGVTPVQLEGFD